MPPPMQASRAAGRLARALDSDIMFHSFLRSKVTILSAIVTLVFFAGAFLRALDRAAQPVRPGDDLHSGRPLRRSAWSIPIRASCWAPTTRAATSSPASLYGARISLAVGFLSVFFAAIVGIAGPDRRLCGGWVDAVIMRIADVQLTFPAILIALLIDGVARGLFGNRPRAASPSGS
jgi:peptide/nickel transport system permease protein